MDSGEAICRRRALGSRKRQTGNTRARRPLVARRLRAVLRRVFRPARTRKPGATPKASARAEKDQAQYEAPQLTVNLQTFVPKNQDFVPQI